MQSIAHDFPEIAKTYSIGKSFEGRDINVIELTSNAGSSETPKVKQIKEKNLLQTDDDESLLLIYDEDETKSEEKPDDKADDKKAEKKSEEKPAEDKKGGDKKKAEKDYGFKYTGPEVNDGKPTILQTGATHARELISTNLNVYQMLKLLKKGEIEKNDEWKQLLEQNKYIFMPIYNVDGVNFIEENWVKNHKIIPKRKNMDMNENSGNPVEAGVDLNR